MVRFILLLRRCASRCGGEYNVRFTLKNMTEVGNKHLYEYFIITDITHKARIYRRNKKDTTAETIKIIDRAHLPGKMALKRKNTAPRQRCMFPRRDAALPDRSGATTRPDHIEFILGGDQISMGALRDVSLWSYLSSEVGFNNAKQHYTRSRFVHK